MHTPMSSPLAMEKRSLQFILQRIALRGAHFALPSI
jgi:hypothetical protein